MTYFTNKCENLEVKYLTDGGEFGLNCFKTKKNDGNLEILKRTMVLPVVSQLQVLRQHGWERREGSCGWLLGCSHERALLCATCTGMGNDENGE